MKEAVVYIEGEIVSSIDSVATKPYCLPSEVRADLESQKPFDSIRCIINSCGGSANGGMAIRDMLVGYKVPLHMEGIGVVGSIATTIFAKGQTRQLSPHCKFFIHLPFGGVRGSADEIAAYAEAMKRLEEEMFNIYEAMGLKVDREELVRMCQRETELSAQQALEYGFATSLAQEVTAKQLILTDLPGINSNKTNSNKMNQEERKEAKGILEKIAKYLGLKEEPKALMLTLENGTQVNINSEGENPQVGDEVTNAETGEAVADGVYTLSNDQVITVAAGKITEIADAPADDDAEMQALKDENEKLKQQLEDVKAKQQEFEQTAKKAAEDVKAFKERETSMKAEFEKLEKLMQSTGNPKRDADPKREPAKAEKKTAREMAIERNLGTKTEE